MKRSAYILGLLTSLSLFWAAAAHGQDKVKYADPKTGKEAEATGAIQQETPSGITLRQGVNSKLIPAASIHHVIYRIANVNELDYGIPFRREDAALKAKDAVERRKFEGEALVEYEKLSDKARANSLAYRYVQYRLALLQAHMARTDSTKRAAALEALDRFRKDHSAGWEIVPCLKLLAQLQEEKGDLAGASETYKGLRILPDVSKDQMAESGLLIANMLLRHKRFAEAEKALLESQALADSETQKTSILVHLCQAQIMQNKTQNVDKQLTAAIQSTSDATTLALAHNAFGDYWRARQEDEEAFWHYLRVDVLYAVDREEHARALYWLSKLFENVKHDKSKAQECADKLKSKDLEGTEFARRLAGKK